MSKNNFKKILLEENDDNEDINFSLFNEDNNNVVNNEYYNYKDVIDDINDINDINEIDNIDHLNNIEIIDEIEYFEEDLIDNILEKNIEYQDNLNSNSDIKIEVFDDENNEKLVRFSLNVLIDEKSGETIIIDLNITKETYLMIAEELFS